MLKGFNHPLTPKGKSTLNPVFVLVDALYEDKPVSYCPCIFVENDAAIARGWTQGYPKRLGQVFQTRYYAATGKAGPTLARGSKFAGSLTVGGQRLAEALVTLKEPVTDLSPLRQRPIVDLLHYPIERGKRVASHIETGMVFINYPDVSAPDLPFGGIKRSGYGKELSNLGLEEFVNKKLILVPNIPS